MNKIWDFLTQHYSIFYKVFLFLVSLVILVSFFPKEAKFKYEYTKGRPWQHDDLIAPFDFPILKAPEEVEKERNEIMANRELFFDFNIQKSETIRTEFIDNFNNYWALKYGTSDSDKNLKQASLDRGLKILTATLNRGIIQTIPAIENKPPDYQITLIISNTAEKVRLGDLYNIHTAYEKIKNMLAQSEGVDAELLKLLLEESMTQNVSYNESMTQKELQNYLNQISSTRGMTQEGERIISKGELINKNKFQILESLRQEYEARLGQDSNYYLILAGQVLLVAISLMVLVFFLYFFRRDVLRDNKKVILILLVLILMVFLTSVALRIDPQFIYLVPLCIGTILIRVFFDTRLALYVYLIMIILIGFLVPNSFQFLFMELIAGIITIFSIVNLQKRSQFLFTAFVVFLSYAAIYTGLNLIQEGNFSTIRPVDYAMFGGSALLILVAYPLIYLFERMFSLVTDVTLLELSDTNSKLLRELSMRAPGTFQHSLQVANLAEECIYEIGGDALITRTGALYHDIGKMNHPMYFIENQVTGVNPHDELTYEESARIIIDHVIDGIEKAKKAKLPEQIIDFIRTHHGNSKVGYFYTMQQKENPDEKVDPRRFTYPGPIPFSKETSVVMMSDSVEAASRSLKIIDEVTINNLVENIINKQMESGQFINSNITLRDINKTKKILKKKLMNIYHIRIEYPK
ncbi:MAG: HDIG domain-containing protein [Bacteroidales bacterium]|jgi:putative nucleotidyltransferase with HDIG domain|nr:HDIG domain-containing protein [Bacteroidales bacterium]NCU35422.1 HDIG domain-containing protein [Candidatus Falkowbacteria bacterium]MDD2632153.1 HDIG domain-containing protein [Bacteroidales bacterium]MDD3130786.1 HDIG domain-containing protein [Bacteroidales bacterium]MDD3525525.1 HDIG domain-containing protein [Bacteroidales bacterium]